MHGAACLRPRGRDVRARGLATSPPITAEAETEPPVMDDLWGKWLRPTDARAAEVRAAEAKIFPEIPELMQPYEADCVFLALQQPPRCS